MALHPDLLDKHLLLLSRRTILNPPLAFPTCVRYTYRDSVGDVEIDLRSGTGINNRQEIGTVVAGRV